MTILITPPPLLLPKRFLFLNAIYDTTSLKKVDKNPRAGELVRELETQKTALTALKADLQTTRERLKQFDIRHEFRKLIQARTKLPSLEGDEASKKTALITAGEAHEKKLLLLEEIARQIEGIEEELTAIAADIIRLNNEINKAKEPVETAEIEARRVEAQLQGAQDLHGHFDRQSTAFADLITADDKTEGLFNTDIEQALEGIKTASAEKRDAFSRQVADFKAALTAANKTLEQLRIALASLNTQLAGKEGKQNTERANKEKKAAEQTREKEAEERLCLEKERASAAHQEAERRLSNKRDEFTASKNLLKDQQADLRIMNEQLFRMNPLLDALTRIYGEADEIISARGKEIDVANVQKLFDRIKENSRKLITSLKDLIATKNLAPSLQIELQNAIDFNVDFDASKPDKSISDYLTGVGLPDKLKKVASAVNSADTFVGKPEVQAYLQTLEKPYADFDRLFRTRFRYFLNEKGVDTAVITAEKKAALENIRKAANTEVFICLAQAILVYSDRTSVDDLINRDRFTIKVEEPTETTSYNITKGETGKYLANGTELNLNHELITKITETNLRLSTIDYDTIDPAAPPPPPLKITIL